MTPNVSYCRISSLTGFTWPYAKIHLLLRKSFAPYALFLVHKFVCWNLLLTYLIYSLWGTCVHSSTFSLGVVLPSDRSQQLDVGSLARKLQSSQLSIWEGCSSKLPNSGMFWGHGGVHIFCHICSESNVQRHLSLWIHLKFKELTNKCTSKTKYKFRHLESQNKKCKFNHWPFISGYIQGAA